MPRIKINKYEPKSSRTFAVFHASRKQCYKKLIYQVWLKTPVISSDVPLSLPKWRFPLNFHVLIHGPYIVLITHLMENKQQRSKLTIG